MLLNESDSLYFTYIKTTYALQAFEMRIIIGIISIAAAFTYSMVFMLT